MKKFLLACMILPLCAAELDKQEYVTLRYGTVGSTIPLVGKWLFPLEDVKIPRTEWEQRQQKYAQWKAQHPVANRVKKTAILLADTAILTLLPLLFAVLESNNRHGGNYLPPS